MNGNIKWILGCSIAVFSLIGGIVYQYAQTVTIVESAIKELNVLRVENQAEHKDIKTTISDKIGEHTELRSMIYEVGTKNQEELKRQAILLARIAEKVGVNNP